MSSRVASLVGLAFAALWLWLGAGALSPSALGAAVGVVGTLLLAVIAVIALRRQSGGAGRFIRSRYRIAVLAELAGMAAVAFLINRFGLADRLWPMVGVVVGLHFIGLWWASGRARFLALSAGMTALNLVALVGPADWRVPLAGLGSAVALASAVALG